MQTPVSAIVPFARPSGSPAPPSVIGDGSVPGGWWQANTFGVMENVAPPCALPWSSTLSIVSVPSGSSNVNVHSASDPEATSQDAGSLPFGSSEYPGGAKVSVVV